MTYRSVVATQTGPPEVLKVRINDLRPYLEDWATLFQLLEERKIEPIIMQKFPILEAAKANELLESGHVVGNVVLVTPELM